MISLFLCTLSLIAKIAPNTHIIGQNIIYFNQIDSTNSFAQELIKDRMVENGTIIFAEEQIRGKGQRLKSWISEPKKNLTFSIILTNNNNKINNPFILNKLIAVTILEILRKYMPNNDIEIKWPNDLMVNRKKISGILIENNFIGHLLNFSIIGIGININQENTLVNATSFYKLLKIEQNRAHIFKYFIEKLDINYRYLLTDGATFFENQFNQNLLGLGILNLFKVNDNLIEAKILGCDNNGSIIIETKNGIQKFQHGTIQQIINE
ncbi:MAG: biotin--[acetyl-CoA-carboxylase] ligase [Bacteroidota bacterium]|nr:biotin--[acetyl-CoA-carboxylase] ligase [Bacteroidota bacterium]